MPLGVGPRSAGSAPHDPEADFGTKLDVEEPPKDATASAPTDSHGKLAQNARKKPLAPLQAFAEGRGKPAFQEATDISDDSFGDSVRTGIPPEPLKTVSAAEPLVAEVLKFLEESQIKLKTLISEDCRAANGFETPTSVPSPGQVAATQNTPGIPRPKATPYDDWQLKQPQADFGAMVDVGEPSKDAPASAPTDSHGKLAQNARKKPLALLQANPRIAGCVELPNVPKPDDMPNVPKPDDMPKELPQASPGRDAVMTVSDDEAPAKRKDGNDRARHRVSHRAVFVDATAIKKSVKKAVLKKNYTVTIYYKEHGMMQAIARHPFFDNLTLFVVFLNALWIAYECDKNDADILSQASTDIQVGEHLFCTYFTLEWLIRFFAFQHKRDCLKDAWFRFDTLLAALTIMETWLFVLLAELAGLSSSVMNTSILKVFRLIRLTKLARMMRLVRAVPELAVLCKGIVIAIRSMLFTMILLSVIIFLFAIFFRQLAKGSAFAKPGNVFHSVPAAINTLLIAGAFPDLADLLNSLLEENVLMWFTMLVFVGLSALTVMNMLIGVLVEVVGAVSRAEKEQMDMKIAHNIVEGFVSDAQKGAEENEDYDPGEVMVPKSSLQDLLKDEPACRALNDLQVDVVSLVDMLDVFFYNNKPMKMGDLVEKIMQLRGSNSATVKDIVDLRHYLANEVAQLQDKIMGTNSAKEKMNENNAMQDILKR